MTRSQTDAEGDGITVRAEREVLALLAQLVAVTAVALPVSAFVARAIAFGMCDRIGSPGLLHLAAAQSLADLTVGGLFPLLFAVPAYVLAVAQVARIMRRGEQRRLGIGRSTVRSRWSRPATYLVFVAAGFVTLAAYAITGLLWLFGVVIILAGLVGVWLLWIYRRHRSLRPAWTWPVLVLCFVVGSVVSGLVYNDVPVANLTLDPATGVPPGQYLELGRTSDTLYLLSCTDTQGGVIGIPSAAVLRAEYAPKPDWLIRLRSLTDPRPLGLDTNCR